MRAIGMWVVSVLLAAAIAAEARAADNRGEQALTLRVDGELSIDPHGAVQEYRLITRLDPEIETLLRRAVPRWRFKPILVDGKPVVATSPMRITLAAIEKEQGYLVKVDNVVFWPNTPEQHAAAEASRKAHPRMTVEGQAPGPAVWITSRSLRPPKYPSELQRAGVEGIVLLNLRLNPDGTVAEVFAAQSSLLNVRGSAGLLDRGRTLLERNASAAAKGWTFEVDAELPASLTAEDLTVRVPVEYSLALPGREPERIAGKWRHEFRGPHQPAPWLPAGNAPKVGVSDLDSNEILAGVSPFELSDNNVIGAAL